MRASHQGLNGHQYYVIMCVELFDEQVDFSKVAGWGLQFLGLKNILMLVLIACTFPTLSAFAQQQGHKPPPMATQPGFGQGGGQMQQLYQYIQGVDYRVRQLEQIISDMQNGNGGHQSSEVPLGYHLTLCTYGEGVGGVCYKPEYKYTMNYLIVKTKEQYNYNLKQCADLVRQRFNNYADKIESIGISGFSSGKVDLYSGESGTLTDVVINKKANELCTVITNFYKNELEGKHAPEQIWEAAP